MLGVLQTIKSYWFLVPFIVLLYLNIRDFGRAASLVRRVFPDTGWRSAATIVGKLFLGHWWLLASWSKYARLRAARLFVEIEILNPGKEAPNNNDYKFPEETGKYHVDLNDWERSERERKEDISKYMKQQLREERSGFYSRVWDLVKTLRSGKGQSEERIAHTRSFVPLKSFAALDESRPLIQRYFNVLNALGEDTITFVSRAQIETGYLSPIFLITGLVNRFKDEDGWKLVLDNYRRLVEDDREYSDELRELRAFLFNCWLLWGPSIPPCECSMWSPASKSRQNDLVLQYGYGDENNSIDLIVKDGMNKAFVEDLFIKLRPVSARNNESVAVGPIALCAIPYTVTGHFGWGPNRLDEEICEAQRMIQGGTGPLREPSRGRVFLECQKRDVEPRDQKTSSRYYSAYLWVIFVIMDVNGEPFYKLDHELKSTRRTGMNKSGPIKIQSWKNLLPFFEHGNIADATTYQTLKENLARKICSSLREILERDYDCKLGKSGKQELKLQYACAFDDSNCGLGHDIIFKPAEVLGDKNRKSRLRDILWQYIVNDDVLRAAVDRTRLLLPESSPSSEENTFSSCHLPAMIEVFYKELERDVGSSSE